MRFFDLTVLILQTVAHGAMQTANRSAAECRTMHRSINAMTGRFYTD